MPFRFVAIKPTRPVADTKRLHAELAAELNGFVTEVEEKMATYPPQQPTVSGYIRTGTLMRSWSVVPAKSEGGALVAKVGSNAGIAPYNIWVQGDQQTGEMSRRNWRKVMDVAKELWPGAVQAIRAAFARAAR